MEKQKLIELLRKAYLSGIMEKELADKMQGFKHDFESMATHYAEIEVNNGVLDDVSNSLPDHVVKFRLQELEMKYDYLMEQFNKMNDC